MTYLLVGEDSLAKDQKIAEFKERFFTSQDALKFDYEVLHAHRLDAFALKETLVSLPAFAQKKVIVIRECQRLSPHNKELITEFVKKPHEACVLILDFDTQEKDDPLLRQLGRSVKIFFFQGNEKIDVFNLSRAISQHRDAEALKILNLLFLQGNHPLQIMGGLVWFWGRLRQRISSQAFKKGLLAFKEADVNIKRSHLNPEYALEVLVVKLCSLGV